MDRFYPSPPLSSHPDSLPFGRASSQIEPARQTVTPSSSVTDGARLTPSHHVYPCSAIGKWTSSHSGSSETAMSHYHHQQQQHHYHTTPLWKAPLYRPSSSSPSSASSEEEVPSLFPTHGVESSEWSSHSTAPSCPESKQVKLEPGSSYESTRHSLLWSRTPGTQQPGCSLESGTYSVPSQIAAPYPTRPDTFKTACPTPRLPPPSLAFPSSGHRSFLSDKVKTHANRPGSHHEESRPSPDDIGEEANSEAPYSCLIEKALLEAPDKKLTLQDIYSWFEKRTVKGKDRASKGWQNSVRHNLSMNAGFEAVREEEPGKKPQNYWRLTEEAVKYGVQSTTRYRKQASNKKTSSSDPPAPQRQRSGAKGGKATKIKAKLRGRPSGEDELRKDNCQREITQPTLQRMTYGHGYPSTTTTTSATASVISSFHVSVPVTRLSTESFDLGNAVGCADPHHYFAMPGGQGSDCLTMENSFLPWGGHTSFSAGLMTGPGITADLPLGI